MIKREKLRIIFYSFCIAKSKIEAQKSFIKKVAIDPEPRLVLKLFLNFGQSEPCSYKVVLIKKKKKRREFKKIKFGTLILRFNTISDRIDRITQKTTAFTQNCNLMANYV